MTIFFVRNKATTMLPPTRFYFNWKVMCSRGIFLFFVIIIIETPNNCYICSNFFMHQYSTSHTQRSHKWYKCIRYGFKCFYITLALLLLSELDERHDTDEDSCDVCFIVGTQSLQLEYVWLCVWERDDMMAIVGQITTKSHEKCV